jgi:hypothetical protein
MTRPAVELSARARRAACHAIAQALLFHHVELVELAVCTTHFHLLARFTPLVPQAHGLQSVGFVDDPPRHYVGIAKKESARALSKAGLVAPGGVWAKRCKVVAIRSREHQLQVVRYIREHSAQGAAVWSMIRHEQGE